MNYFRTGMFSLFLLILSGCASSGRDFNESAITQLQPGITTLMDATTLLGSKPVQTVNRADGYSVSFWRYIQVNGLVATTHQKEVGLVFGPDGRYVRVFHQVNQ